MTNEWYLFDICIEIRELEQMEPAVGQKVRKPRKQISKFSFLLLRFTDL
jgi:hypothetical protein